MKTPQHAPPTGNVAYDPRHHLLILPIPAEVLGILLLLILYLMVV